MQWKVGDRVKVSPDHYGTGLQTKLGTVLRVVDDCRVEVVMDQFNYGVGVGIVTFKAEDLVFTPKKIPRHAHLVDIARMVDARTQ